MMPRMGSRRTYTDEEVDAAVRALSEPGRLDEAQRLVLARAPQLQAILNSALTDSDWFGVAHRDEVRKAVAPPEAAEREDAVSRLIAEETRLTMLVGVAAGLELAHLLDEQQED
jgi:hypothetical protein